MCQPGIKFTAPATVGAMLAVTLLAGCSDLYFRRQDTIALSAGNAVAANEIAQMTDPWPPRSGNTAIAFNGQKMQSAAERYRSDKVTRPVNPTTSAIQSQQPGMTVAASNQGAVSGSAASAPTSSSVPSSSSGQ